jgi:hypothetical protein
MAPPTTINDPATAYSVHEFQALRPRRPDGEAEAMELLRRAAWQVQPIMKRRQWRIAVLRELEPENRTRGACSAAAVCFFACLMLPCSWRQHEPRRGGSHQGAAPGRRLRVVRARAEGAAA